MENLATPPTPGSRFASIQLCIYISFLWLYLFYVICLLQKKTILQNTPLLQKAIEEVCTSLSPGTGSTMVVADLGCSSGPNTLLFVAEVLGAISGYNQLNTDHKQGGAAFEVQFFLNDLPSNDFNLVFQMLDQFQNDISSNRKEEGKETMYYVAGLPGSFYKRLFPCKSVHIFHSSYCLQWLSKVNIISASYYRHMYYVVLYRRGN
jgi:jasmonate O-methyltransferase